MKKHKGSSKKSKASNKKNEITNPHDVTFKKLFGELDVAKDVIENNLPQEVLDQLDMDSLKRLDGSFISDKLRETFTDLLYGVRIKNRDAYIALLWEHKSYADKFAVFQVAGYILDIWRAMLKDGKDELPVVIPIVVYHGKDKWNYKTDIREMIPDFDILPEYLKQMLPIIKHEFIDISAHTDEEIQEYEPVTRMIIKVFKYIYWDIEDLVKAFLESVDEVAPLLISEELYRLLDILLIYFSAANKDITEEDIKEMIKTLGGKGEKIMTILQEREQKGMERGIERGIERGEIKKAREMAVELIKMRMDKEDISTVTKLTVQEVEEIEKELRV